MDYCYYLPIIVLNYSSSRYYNILVDKFLPIKKYYLENTYAYINRWNIMLIIIWRWNKIRLRFIFNQSDLFVGYYAKTAHIFSACLMNNLLCLSRSLCMFHWTYLYAKIMLLSSPKIDVHSSRNMAKKLFLVIINLSFC